MFATFQKGSDIIIGFLAKCYTKCYQYMRLLPINKASYFACVSELWGTLKNTSFTFKRSMLQRRIWTCCGCGYVCLSSVCAEKASLHNHLHAPSSKSVYRQPNSCIVSKYWHIFINIAFFFCREKQCVLTFACFFISPDYSNYLHGMIWKTIEWAFPCLLTQSVKNTSWENLPSRAQQLRSICTPCTAQKRPAKVTQTSSESLVHSVGNRKDPPSELQTANKPQCTTWGLETAWPAMPTSWGTLGHHTVPRKSLPRDLNEQRRTMVHVRN